MNLADEKYLALTTFRKNGERKVTAIWIADIGGGALGFTTGSDAWKLKRLRNDSRCELQPCDMKGRVTEGSLVATATGRESTAQEFAVIKSAIDSKYGFSVKLISALEKIRNLTNRSKPTPTGIVITVDE